MMKYNNPLVSICMPAYNAGKYITEAIESVITQTYTNWELIIVNDGSTDDTAAQLEKLTDHRIKVYYQQNNGQCIAANKAFSLSKGELIKFMDADDLISCDFLKSQIAVVDGKTDVIASAVWGRFYNNDINTFNVNTDIITADFEPINWLKTAMYNRQVMLQCALWLIPRQILEEAGLWHNDLSLINDFEFFIRVLLAAKLIRFASEAVLYYRSGLNNSLSTLKSRKGAQSAFTSISLGTSYLLNAEDSALVKSIAANCFQDFAYTFYPYHKDLVIQAEIKVKELGGASTSFPAGGYTRVISSVIGWKLTKVLKRLFSN
jgi:glycosyltransferase involved in cell wall biosynthesis